MDLNLVLEVIENLDVRASLMECSDSGSNSEIEFLRKQEFLLRESFCDDEVVCCVEE